jgi:hypothetical protein
MIFDDFPVNLVTTAQQFRHSPPNLLTMASLIKGPSTFPTPVWIIVDLSHFNHPKNAAVRRSSVLNAWTWLLKRALSTAVNPLALIAVASAPASKSALTASFCPHAAA